jgi:hypothetical protein
LETPERFDALTRQTMERFRGLGERLQAGPLEQIEALGPQRHIGLVQPTDSALCIGWRAVLSAEDVHERMKKASALWAS